MKVGCPSYHILESDNYDKWPLSHLFAHHVILPPTDSSLLFHGGTPQPSPDKHLRTALLVMELLSLICVHNITNIDHFLWVCFYTSCSSKSQRVLIFVTVVFFTHLSPWYIRSRSSFYYFSSTKRPRLLHMMPR